MLRFQNNFFLKDRGKLTDIVLHLHGDHQFAVDDGDYFSFSEIIDFKVLDTK